MGWGSRAEDRASWWNGVAERLCLVDPQGDHKAGMGPAGSSLMCPGCLWIGMRVRDGAWSEACRPREEKAVSLGAAGSHRAPFFSSADQDLTEGTH